VDSKRQELEQADISVVAQITLRKEQDVSLGTPLHNPGFTPYMKMVIVRELEKKGLIDPIPDDELRGWVVASRGWLTAESLVVAVSNRLRDKG